MDKFDLERASAYADLRQAEHEILQDDFREAHRLLSAAIDHLEGHEAAGTALAAEIREFLAETMDHVAPA